MQEIVLVGCGNMGASLLTPIFSKKIANIKIITKNPDKHLDKFPGVQFFKTVDEADIEAGAIIILAVKPHQLQEILPHFKKNYQRYIFISIAAFKKFSFFFEQLGEDVKIVRLMPNMAARIGKSISGMMQHNLQEPHVKSVKKVFDLTGKIIELETEEDFNKMTVICGCGPAFLYYFMECMLKSTIDMGFSMDSADSMVKDMVKGASMLINDTDILEDLRKSITSKGGITEAALQVMMDQENGFSNTIEKTFLAGLAKSSQ